MMYSMQNSSAWSGGVRRAACDSRHAQKLSLHSALTKGKLYLERAETFSGNRLATQELRVPHVDQDHVDPGGGLFQHGNAKLLGGGQFSAERLGTHEVQLALPPDAVDSYRHIYEAGMGRCHPGGAASMGSSLEGYEYPKRL